MFGIGDKILAYLGGGAALALGLLLAFIWVSKDAQIAVYKTQADQQSHQIDIANANVLTLKGGLGECNAGIDRLKMAGDTATAKANAALVEAEKISGNLRTSAADVLKARPSADKCRSADALILGHLK